MVADAHDPNVIPVQPNPRMTSTSPNRSGEHPPITAPTINPMISGSDQLELAELHMMSFSSDNKKIVPMKA